MERAVGPGIVRRGGSSPPSFCAKTFFPQRKFFCRSSCDDLQSPGFSHPEVADLFCQACMASPFFCFPPTRRSHSPFSPSWKGLHRTILRSEGPFTPLSPFALRAAQSDLLSLRSPTVGRSLLIFAMGRCFFLFFLAKKTVSITI